MIIIIKIFILNNSNYFYCRSSHNAATIVMGWYEYHTIINLIPCSYRTLIKCNTFHEHQHVLAWVYNHIISINVHYSF